MLGTPAAPSADPWSEWLLKRRHAGDPAYQAVVQRTVEGYAAHVLERANLAPGMRILDVGAGEGLLAFAALQRMGGRLEAILSDLSPVLLTHAAALAEQRGFTTQCRFLQCSAERLAIADASVEAVVARSCIAYVADKKAAFAEMFRVLRPGGRLSIAEPVFQDEAFYVRALRRGLQARQANAPADGFLVLLHRWKSRQFPDDEQACAANPLVNYAERDLLDMVRGAGFGDIHLQFHVDVEAARVTNWQTFVEIAPHPWAPSLADIMAQEFSAEERALLEAVLRPSVESGAHPSIDRMAYLNAVKPAR